MCVDDVLRGDPIAELVLSVQLKQEILAHLDAARPNEGVGLLAVAREEDALGRVLATAFFPGTNIDASPTHFTMAPEEVFRAVRVMEARAWRLGAIVHSHVLSPAMPSKTDLREAFYLDAVLMIASFADVLPDLRAWRIVEGDEERKSLPIPVTIVRSFD